MNKNYKTIKEQFLSGLKTNYKLELWNIYILNSRKEINKSHTFIRFNVIKNIFDIYDDTIKVNNDIDDVDDIDNLSIENLSYIDLQEKISLITHDSIEHGNYNLEDGFFIFTNNEFYSFNSIYDNRISPYNEDELVKFIEEHPDYYRDLEYINVLYLYKNEREYIEKIVNEYLSHIIKSKKHLYVLTRWFTNKVQQFISSDDKDKNKRISIPIVKKALEKTIMLYTIGITELSDDE